MKEEYRKMSIREVIAKLPLDEMVLVLKEKGLTNEEIIELLKDEKARLIKENNERNWLYILETLFNDMEENKKLT